MVVDTPAGGRVTGFYLGTVVKHLPHGKLKVFIPSVYPDEWKDQPLKLPTCMQVTPQFAGSNKGNGMFSYPNIGATVLCGFANGDQNLPFTLGGVLGGENAFGQYEMIKAHDEEVSKRHLITSGKSHLEFYESGKISAAVYDPIRTDASVDYTNNIVSCRHLCEQVSANEISNINCQAVLDNAHYFGMLSTSTHFYNNADGECIINNWTRHDNTECITLSSACVDTGSNLRDAHTTVNGNSTANVGLHEETVDNIQRCKIVVDKTATNGKIEVMIADLDDPSNNFSRLYLDKKGNIYIESTASIVMKTKTMKVEVENTLNIASATCKSAIGVDASIVSPSINLDSSAGHTTIRSTTGVKSF